MISTPASLRRQSHINRSWARPRTAASPLRCSRVNGARRLLHARHEPLTAGGVGLGRCRCSAGGRCRRPASRPSRRSRRGTTSGTRRCRRRPRPSGSRTGRPRRSAGVEAVDRGLVDHPAAHPRRCRGWRRSTSRPPVRSRRRRAPRTTRCVSIASQSTSQRSVAVAVIWRIVCQLTAFGDAAGDDPTPEMPHLTLVVRKVGEGPSRTGRARASTGRCQRYEIDESRRRRIAWSSRRRRARSGR